MRTDYDAVVIGAGIHGAATAQALSARGYDVLVVERTAVAAGTSSRSSKLVHGGLRYLESGQFKLVRESLHERSWLLTHAPSLVRLVPFYIPVYRGSRRRPWQIRLGLALYAALTGFSRDGRFRRVPTTEWEGLDGLSDEGLKAVYQYWDAQTDDAALTEAVVRSAQRLGAEVLLPARVTGARLDDDGCRVTIDAAGESRQVQCRVLINASGPWVNRVLAEVIPEQPRLPVDLVQGTHIVVPGELERGIYYVEAEDGRAVFVMPWQGRVMVGTTEHLYTGDPADVQPTQTEIAYLLRTLARHFPAFSELTSHSVTEAFAGLRVLPTGTGTAFSRPRDTVLHTDRPRQPRLVSIYGGKLTAHRATAARVVDLVGESLPAKTPRVDWGDMVLE